MVGTYSNSVQCGVVSVRATDDLDFTSVIEIRVIEIARASSLIDCLLDPQGFGDSVRTLSGTRRFPWFDELDDNNQDSTGNKKQRTYLFILGFNRFAIPFWSVVLLCPLRKLLINLLPTSLTDRKLLLNESKELGKIPFRIIPCPSVTPPLHNRFLIV